MTSRWNSGMFFNFYTFGFYCNNRNSIISRAGGTDLVRLRPASASVRFLRNFAGPPSESVLEADERCAFAVRLRPLRENS